MKKSILSLIIFSVCLLLLPNTIGSARGIQANPVVMPVADETSFTFVQLREEELRMFGPFATETLLFRIASKLEVAGGCPT